MKQVTFIFATGKSWLDLTVTTITKSIWSHAALRFDADNLLVEALAGRGLILQAGGKYEGWSPSVTITKLIPEPAYDEMLRLSRAWSAAGISYGYRTCAAIGVKELFGQRVGRLALGIIAGGDSETRVCTELLVMLWRIAVPEFLPGREPRLISPDELYRGLTEEFPNR